MSKEIKCPNCGAFRNETQEYCKNCRYKDPKIYSEEEILLFSWWLLRNVGRTSNDRIAHFEDKYYLNLWIEQNKKK